MASKRNRKKEIKTHDLSSESVSKPFFSPSFLENHNTKVSCIAFLFFSILSFYFFSEQISQTKYFWSNYWSDFTEIYIPFLKVNIEAVSQGEVAFWNPYAYGGMVHMAESTSLFFYPVLYPFYFILSLDSDLFYFLTLFTIFHFVFIQLGIYLLLRHLKLGFIASLFGAIVFAFSCAMICRWQFLIIVFCLTWMPYALLYLLKILDAKKFVLNHIAFCSLFLSLSYLGGHPQYFFYNLLFFGIIILAYLIKNYVDNKNITDSGKQLLFASLPFVMCFGLICIQLLPLLELIPNTQRDSITYDFAADGSYQWKQLFSFLHPYVYGLYRGNEPIDFVNYYATPGKVYHFWETAYFFGTIPLILSLFGIYKFRRNFTVQLLLIASVLFFLHALGDNGFLFKYLFALPGFSSFRIPSRTLLYLVFAFCIISSFSLDYFLKTRYSRKDLLVLLGLILSVSLFAFYISNGGTGLTELSAEQLTPLKYYGLSALLFAWFSSIVLVPYFRKSGWSYSLGLFFIIICFYDLSRMNKSYKNSDIDIKSSMQIDDQLANVIKAPKDDLFRFAASEGRARILKRNQASFNGIYSIDGFYGFNLKTRSDMPVNWPINDLMSVAITSDIKTNESGQAGISLTQHPSAQAHLRMNYNYIINSDKTIDGNTVDFINVAVLEKEPGISLSKRSASEVVHEVKLTEYKFNTQRVHINTEEPGLLIAAEYYYPNWHTYLDGKKVETLKANYLTRGVVVPAGDHEVTFKFESSAFNLGLWISLLSLFICTILLISPHFNYLKHRLRLN